MYDLIEKKRSVRKLYTEALIGRGDITVEDAEDGDDQVPAAAGERVQGGPQPRGQGQATSTGTGCRPTRPKAAAKHGTAITIETLKKIADAHTTFPDGFTVHPKVMPQLQRRAAAITQGPIDWATGEILALGSLLLDGRTVRLTGQDTRRGTFVQRFASIVDRKTGESWVPLKHLDEEQGKFHVFDSLLSEYAAMGFEYGYSVANPEALVLWEAQFGDFANGAQTIIDEFITSGQAKWTQKSGVVLLLPHGYEGQGPDHSSGRIERWLQLAAEDAFTVAQPSTPASHFHMLRQQALGEMHRPLIVFTPKSMLRNKLAVSDPADFTRGSWKPVLHDPDDRGPEPGHLGASSARARCAGTWSTGGPPPGWRARWRSCRWSGSIRCPGKQIADYLSRFEQRQRGPLGAGRAEQPGRLAVHRAQPAADARRGDARTDWKLTPITRSGVLGPGGRLGQGARGAAAGADGRGVRAERPSAGRR